MNSNLKKYVYIIRHAKSSWAQPLMSDHNRPLNERGFRDATFMSGLLLSIGFKIDKIVSSTANRAKTTASYFSKVYNREVHLEKKLYHGEPDDFMEIMYEQPEDVKALAIFGHNPGITYFANMIKPAVTDNIPTCGIVICTVNADIPWENISIQDMYLEQILTPKKPVP